MKIKGYTKAVDLWSLGCVTATLLTGATPFSSFGKPADRRTSYDIIMEAAVKCDLNHLNMSTQWRLASREAKDFVSRLLVLNETARMTAVEGLHHIWYENWRDDFDEVYRFSLRNYRPRIHIPNVVEKIDLQAAAGKAKKEVSPSTTSNIDSLLDLTLRSHLEWVLEKVTLLIRIVATGWSSPQKATFQDGQAYRSPLQTVPSKY